MISIPPMRFSPCVKPGIVIDIGSIAAIGIDGLLAASHDVRPDIAVNPRAGSGRAGKSLRRGLQFLPDLPIVLTSLTTMHHCLAGHEPCLNLA
jgi:hypothetical protein